MITTSTITRGLRSGLSITWELSKVVIPVYFIITFLKYTPVLNWIAELMVPIMTIVGLPGETSLPLVIGYTLNIYAAIGAILPLGLEVREITILSAMVLISHALPMETAIAKKTGVKTLSLVITRIVLSFLIGILFNFLL